VADNLDILILPNRDGSSIVLSETSSSLAARGRKDAAILKLRISKSLAPTGSGVVPDAENVIHNKAALRMFADTPLFMAAERGDAESQNDLGVLYEMAQGYPYGPKYWAQVLLRRSSAKRGDVEAFFRLLLSPRTVRDYAEAAAWYRKAAERGLGVAQVNLGALYASGKGVPQDYEQAAHWYHKAAEQGVGTAQYRLGLLFCSGQGVPGDGARAAFWLRKAAEQRVAIAQYELGLLYGKGGKGLPRNDGEAYFWLSLAASPPARANKEKKSNAHAEEYSCARDAAADKLTSAELSELQGRLNHWLTVHPPKM
jgi:TPR repeat protein